MNWRLWPYVEQNGAWSLKDDTMLLLFEEAKRANLIKKVFFNGEVATSDDWLRLMKRPQNIVHTIWGEDENPYLIAWLNDWGPNFAFAHFITYPRAWGKYTVELLGECFKYWFKFKNHDGDFLLDLVVGRTPAHRPEVTHFLDKLGAHVLGEIPMMGYDVYKQQKVGMIISYLTREGS